MMPTDFQPSSANADVAFDLPRFLELAGGIFARHLGGDGAVTVEGHWAGNINLILKLGYQGHALGARITVNHRHFRYEKDIIKEVFAILLLYHAGRTLDDDLVRSIVDGVLSSPQGSHVAHAAVRPILYYDWSMTAFPFPFFLFEWIEGRALWDRPEADLYARAGGLLAFIHRNRFEHFYENIFSIRRVPRPWAGHIEETTGRELAQARSLGLEPAVADRLAAGIGDVSALTPGQPCLVHNDYSGGNILIDGNAQLRIIDWDNWVVDCAELDIVKMKYWTAVGPGGKLVHQPALYQAFLDGYGRAAEEPIHPGRLRVYERLWLLRTFNFERGREVAGTPAIADGWQAVYPAAATYADLLRDL